MKIQKLALALTCLVSTACGGLEEGLSESEDSLVTLGGLACTSAFAQLAANQGFGVINVVNFSVQSPHRSAAGSALLSGSGSAWSGGGSGRSFSGGGESGDGVSVSISRSKLNGTLLGTRVSIGGAVSFSASVTECSVDGVVTTFRASANGDTLIAQVVQHTLDG